MANKKETGVAKTTGNETGQGREASAKCKRATRDKGNEGRGLRHLLSGCSSVTANTRNKGEGGVSKRSWSDENKKSREEGDRQLFTVGE